jgi:hypothetical protein
MRDAWVKLNFVKNLQRHVSIGAFLLCVAGFSMAAPQEASKALDKVEQEQEWLRARLQKYEKAIEVMDKKISEAPKVQEIRPAAVEPPIASLSNGWQSTAYMATGGGVVFVALLFGLKKMRKRKRKERPPLTQKERLSRFAWMPDTGPEFRLFFKEMESFFQKSKELRQKRSAFSEGDRHTFRRYVLGRWILAESTFEEEERIAEEAVKHVIQTFPSKQNHATNRMLLKEAAVMVLRGQVL